MEFVKNHAPKYLQHIIGRWKKSDPDFIELRDCSAEYQTLFLNAWKVSCLTYCACLNKLAVLIMCQQAIESGSEQALIYSIEEMKKMANSESACSTENCLNVCRLVVVTSKHTEKPTCFCMTLLSYAIINKRKHLMEILMNQGAGMMCK